MAEKLDRLRAELRVIELWDQGGATADLEDTLDRAGFKARRLRRLEIIREIDALLNAGKMVPGNL